MAATENPVRFGVNIRRLSFPGIVELAQAADEAGFATAAVAKQAAELSLLSGGRFELGVGISWNPAEYRAVNRAFRTRGRRIEEQITVLCRLWTEPFVSFSGRWHHLV